MQPVPPALHLLSIGGEHGLCARTRVALLTVPLLRVVPSSLFHVHSGRFAGVVLVSLLRSRLSPLPLSASLDTGWLCAFDQDSGHLVVLG